MRLEMPLAKPPQSNRKGRTIASHIAAAVAPYTRIRSFAVAAAAVHAEYILLRCCKRTRERCCSLTDTVTLGPATNSTVDTPAVAASMMYSADCACTSAGSSSAVAVAGQVAAFAVASDTAVLLVPVAAPALAPRLPSSLAAADVR